MYKLNDIKKGIKLEVDGDPYIVVDAQPVKPAKGSAFTRTKMKNLITGNVIERTYRTADSIYKADLEERAMQYLYREDQQYHFMDNENYEQTIIDAKALDSVRGFLKENLSVKVLFFKGRPIGADLPIFVDLKITKCEPGVRGDTAGGATKPATVESGATVQVPLFLNEGDVIKVDTRTGTYIERVKA